MRDEEEATFLRDQTPGIPIIGILPADPSVQEADRLGLPVYDYVPALRSAAEEVARTLASKIPSHE